MKTTKSATHIWAPLAIAGVVILAIAVAAAVMFFWPIKENMTIVNCPPYGSGPTVVWLCNSSAPMFQNRLQAWNAVIKGFAGQPVKFSYVDASNLMMGKCYADLQKQYLTAQPANVALYAINNGVLQAIYPASGNWTSKDLGMWVQNSSGLKATIPTLTYKGN